jgi:hypothetical protein
MLILTGGGGVNVHRNEVDPYSRTDAEGSVYVANKTVRCVVNSPEPVMVSSL